MGLRAQIASCNDCLDDWNSVRNTFASTAAAAAAAAAAASLSHPQVLTHDRVLESVACPTVSSFVLRA